MKKHLLMLLLFWAASVARAAGYGEYANNNADLCGQIIGSGAVRQGSIFCKPSKEGGQVFVYEVQDRRAAIKLAAQIAELAGVKFFIPAVEVSIYANSKDEELKGSIFNRYKPIVFIRVEK